MQIKDLLALEKERTIWVRYIDNFEINIKYLPRRELIRISETSQDTIWDKKAHTKINKLDTDRFYTKFVEKAILGWRGLNLKTLSKIIPINLDGQNLEAEVPYTKENAIELLKNAYDLEAFLQDSIFDIGKFEEEQLEEEEKNL
jgi:hypothetical protein